MGGEGETVYCFVVGMLRDLLVKERAYLQALAGPVDELETKLTRMEELLEYAHVRRDKRTKEIIDLADQLIPSIETYVHHAVFKTSRSFLGIEERSRCSKVRLAIENITTKLNEFINSQRDVDASSLGPSRRDYKVQDLSNLIDEKDFVGREEDINKLVSYLVDEESEKFRVISIHGMGGLGKTTLVRKVYKHDKVLSHFEGFAFVCVSEQCQSEAILKHILQQLVPEKKEEDIKKMSDMVDVIDELQRVQERKKCLVIIDDIWSVGDWEDLNRGLPNGFSGSKVVLTTRIKDVADKGFCFSINSLSEDESWELLQKKIFMDRDSEMDRRKEELGRKMIAWCCGVPLAVLVLRGVLVTKGSAYEWQRFYESRQWGGKVHEEVEKELLFSYNELPYPLKPCFLCLAYFAEDEEIDAQMLYRLWDAEGMILSKDKGEGETMFDVAERYLGELVGRSMVEAKLEEKVLGIGTINLRMTCRLHDLMRGLCLSIVEKENFIKYNDYRGHGDGVVVLNSTSLTNGLKMPARQALCFSKYQGFSVDDKQEETIRHVTSLIFTGGCPKKLSGLKKLNSLRVLKFLKGAGILKADYSFNKLIHLRYLKLNNWCGARALPSSIGNLIYLQTLDLRDFLTTTIEDGFLRKLKRLRHLFLPAILVHVGGRIVKVRMDRLTELETMVNIDSRQFEMKDVIQLSNLRRLEGMIVISGEDDGKELIGGSMNKLNLEPRFSSLRIILRNPKAEVYWDVIRGQVAEYFKGIVDDLEIENLRGKLLPEFSNYSRLTRLLLEEFEVEEDPMPTLERLPNLKLLKLTRGGLKGKEMVCSAMGFPKLRELRFNGVRHWEKWRVEEGAMPNLYKLIISGCSELEMVPDGLKFITSLEILSFEVMGEGFARRLKRGGSDGGEEEGPDFHKIQHVSHLWIDQDRTIHDSNRKIRHDSELIRYQSSW